MFIQLSLSVRQAHVLDIERNGQIICYLREIYKKIGGSIRSKICRMKKEKWRKCTSKNKSGGVQLWTPMDTFERFLFRFS